MTTELNFIILKINGSDVRRLTRNDTVQMFLKAQKESILIEMQRKCNDNDFVDLDEGVNIQSATYDGAVGTIGLTDLITKVTSSPTHNAGDINTKLECLHLSKTSSTTQQHLMLTLKLQKDLQQKQEHTNLISKCTQTENSSGYFAMEQHHQQSLEQHHMASKKHADRLIEEEHSLFEQCLAPEIDIEEITLRKSASNERLGLTVCYSIGESNNSNGSGGSGGSVINNVANIINGSVGDGALSNCDDNEACTEVYISDIHPDSIAGRDGRLRQGDQIIQINGKDVKNKDETEALIAENCNAVTLLVSRYLYADDDDFNDPSVVELDVVDDVYDEDPDVDDVEEDEEDDLYYDDNNLPYENCFIPTEKKFKNAVEDLDKVLLQAAQQQQHLHDSENKAAAISHNIEYKALVDKKSNIQRISNDVQHTSFSTKDSATNFKLKSYVFSDASTNGYYESQKQQHQNKSLNNREISQNQQLVAASKQATATNKLTTAAVHASKSNADYDTEHIYETIPEDSESEPFYCSPYESSVYVTAMGTCSSTVDALQLQQQKHQQQKQQLRVAQWLGLKAQPIPATVTKQLATRTSGSVGNNSRYHRNDTVQSIVTTITNGSSSSGGTNGNSFLAATVAGNSSNALLIDERDNSSSAYNTGGSNNSGSPFVLQLNHQQIAATRNIAAAVEDDQSQMFANARSSNKQMQQRLQSPKDQKIPSPKNSALLLLGSKGAAGGSYVAVGNGVSTIDAQQQYSQKTGYDNESVAHTHQTMGLQQHIMGRQQQEPHILHFPQFTAPNLSQYHFVSSQEVSTTVSSAVAASVNNNGNALHTLATTTTMQHKSKLPSNEESSTMVWKVKRRPDGTRYIVRRPAATIAVATAESVAATPRSRILRADRTLRMRMRSNDNHVVTTTTEDDTISEVKTGRYWSKEERKKHIERARERRQLHLQLQQHLQQLQQNQSYDSSSIPTMRVSDRITNKLQQQQHLPTQQQQPNNIRSTPHQAIATKTKTAANQPELQQYHQLQFKSITMPPAELKISAQFVSAKNFTSDIEFYGAMESRTDTEVETTATATDVTNDEAGENKFYEQQTQHCKPSNLSQQENAIATEDGTRIINVLQTMTSV